MKWDEKQYMLFSGFHLQLIQVDSFRFFDHKQYEHKCQSTNAGKAEHASIQSDYAQHYRKEAQHYKRKNTDAGNAYRHADTTDLGLEDID